MSTDSERPSTTVRGGIGPTATGARFGAGVGDPGLAGDGLVPVSLQAAAPATTAPRTSQRRMRTMFNRPPRHQDETARSRPPDLYLT